MPRRKEILADKIRPYHVLAKAVEGKNIFAAEEDRARFILQMYAANVGRPVVNLYRKNLTKFIEALLHGEEIPEGFVVEKHAPLVEIFSFALVDNHYHLGVVPTGKGTLARFMQKLNLGFAKHFNLKYKRAGALFENRFKVAPIQGPPQLDAVLRYINVKNVLDHHNPQWLQEGVLDRKTALDALVEYPYSSFPDLFGKRNSYFISAGTRSTLAKLLEKDFFLETKDHIKEFEGFYEKSSESLKSLFLE